MSRQNEPAGPGFVMQPSVPVQLSHYPPHGQQPYYPPQQPYYSPQAQQPFPAPIQQQPSYGQQATYNTWWVNTNFQDYLRNAQSFHVKQKVELLEALVGWETPNKYSVKDQSGNKVFYVGEESGCLGRQFCGSRRPFELLAKDTVGRDVLRYSRDLDCSCCCSLFCPDVITVSTPNGQKVGSVVSTFSILNPTFNIKDSQDNTVLKIVGPVCPISCGGSVVFRVMNMSGISVGTISKEWSGLIREIFTDADYFSMSFPIDLDPSIKAVCLGALFLIDFQYFQHN